MTEQRAGSLVNHLADNAYDPISGQRVRHKKTGRVGRAGTVERDGYVPVLYDRAEPGDMPFAPSGARVEDLQLLPEVGTGCTEIGWTDRTAGTIIRVSKTGHEIEVQTDFADRMDSNGMSDAQDYNYRRNPEGSTRTYTRRRDGTYRAKGGTTRLIVGRRDHYHDYSF